jgi:CubicO group peptidase (beta-lactamase class C family)
MPALSNNVDLFPGAELRWGLGYMLNMQPGPNGRSAGTVSWGGIFNTCYWLDPAKTGSSSAACTTRWRQRDRPRAPHRRAWGARRRR